MEYLLYLLILVVIVSVVAGFAQSLLYPFVPISKEGLPRAVAHELGKWGAHFQVDQIRVQKIRQRYVIDGKQGNQPFQLTINLTPDQEFANLTASRLPEKEVFTVIKPIPNGKVPVRVAARLEGCIESDSIDNDTARAFFGVIGNQNAYRVVATGEDVEYRWVVTEDGEVVSCHQKHLQR